MYPLKKRSKNYIPYEFALKNPDPGLICKFRQNDDSVNRTISEEEKTIYFLSTNIEYLNDLSKQILNDLCKQFALYNQKISVDINRVPKISPWFGRKKYKVYYLGCHGEKAISLFLTTYENGENPNIRQCINIMCAKCGSREFTFKLRDNSERVLCAYCLGLVQGKRTVL